MDEHCCIICLDGDGDEELITPSELKCNCVYKVHQTCVNDWFRNEPKCLVCHKQIERQVVSHNNMFMELLYIFAKYYLICCAILSPVLIICIVIKLLTLAY